MEKLEYVVCAMFRNECGEQYFVYKEDDRFWAIGSETDWEPVPIALENGQLTCITTDGFRFSESEAITLMDILVQQK